MAFRENWKNCGWKRSSIYFEMYMVHKMHTKYKHERSEISENNFTEYIKNDAMKWLIRIGDIYKYPCNLIHLLANVLLEKGVQIDRWALLVGIVHILHIWKDRDNRFRMNKSVHLYCTWRPRGLQVDNKRSYIIQHSLPN